MRTAVFLEELQDILQCERPLALDNQLKDMAEWDSLAIMACIAYFDRKLGVKTGFDRYKAINTVADLVALANGKIQ